MSQKTAGKTEKSSKTLTTSARVRGIVILVSKKSFDITIRGVKSEADALSVIIKTLKRKFPDFDICTEKLSVDILENYNGHKRSQKPPYINNNGRCRKRRQK